MAGFVNDEVLQLGRRKGIGDELANVRVPANDVDLFAAEFAHDVLHAHPAHAHASADRINLLVMRQNGNLGPKTCFAGNGLDLHGLVGDFGNFEFKELADKIRMAARENDLGPMDRVVNAQGIGANAVTGLVFFRWDALAAGHDTFNLAQVDDDVAALESSHGARQDVAAASLELLEHHVLLHLPNALQHRLLGRLGGDATEILRGDLD